MRKKVSYQQLLKEAIAEFDTSKTVDVKGPMLEPILAWKGEGELPTHKDAASVLERYYFNEQKDDDIEIEDNIVQEQENVDSQEHAKGEGTEQAGTSPAGDDIDKTKEQIKDKIEGSEETEDETEVIENAVLEKLIAEMEGEDEEAEEKENKEQGEEAVSEQEEKGSEEEEKPEEEEEPEELDIDKEVEEAVLGPAAKDENEEEETSDEEEEKPEELEEVFKLFQEAIESD